MTNLYYRKGNIKIYNQDNLTLLRELPTGSVNLIYNDVLYNSGKTFLDYNDNLGDPEQALRWYEQRLREMKRVLAPNGSIFIHCNWRLNSHLRILMDRIFGPLCFKNCIHRMHSGTRGFYKNFDSQMDTILYYTKDPDNYVFNEIHGNKKQIIPIYENGVLDGRDDVRFFKGEKIDLRACSKHWIVSPNAFKQMVEDDEIRLIDNLPYRFTDAIPIGNLWDEPEMWDNYSHTNTASAYDTPKPEAVLDRIIKMASNEGDTVADFFLGGGTTAVVAKKLNRAGIFCDINKKACDVTVSKLQTLES